MFRRTRIAALTMAVASSVPLAHAQQGSGSSRHVEFRFTPTARAQIALWIEKPDGTFLNTVALTQSVGYRGIGNRPGAAQMNSGFRWPYGRREGVLPVWAHRRALAPGAGLFRQVIFQDRYSEGFASRTTDDSSPDAYFCLSFSQAPTPELRRQDAMDAVTCASQFTSDKGRYLKDSDIGYAEPAVIDGKGVMRPLSVTSLYPPRRDVKPCAEAGCIRDTPDPAGFDQDVRAVMPDIDSVTMATPPANVEQSILFTIPDGWPQGSYVAWAEVNVEGDYNSYFNDQTYPTPITPDVAWDSWAMSSGYPYRGQPSVIFRVPFELGAAPTFTASAAKPTFYGDVDGFGPTGGNTQPMDGRITDDPAGAPGQGADRLRLVAPHDYRFQVQVHGFCEAHEPPSVPGQVVASPVSNRKHSHEWGQLEFVVPSSSVPIAHYEVRFSTEPIDQSDPSTFQRGLPAVAATIDSQALTVPVSGGPGTGVTVDFGGMEPLTRYFVAVRAVDSCNVAGPYGVTEVTTTPINFTKLSGCFVATAAYGSELEPRVEALRRARDALSQGSAFFSTVTDLYYRSGPAAAAVIDRSAVARAVIRHVLEPVVEVARTAFPPTQGIHEGRRRPTH